MLGEGKLEEAQKALDLARANVERVTPIQIELPQCGLGERQVVLDAQGLSCSRAGRLLFGPLDLRIVGPERILLKGANGSGKSSLLRILADVDQPDFGSVTARTGDVAVLDQHLTMLRSEETLLQSVQRHNPDMEANPAHAALARFGFRAQWAVRSVASLSGS